MKILFVIDSYAGPSGGTEKQLLMLVRGLIERGHAVSMCVLRHTPYTRNAPDFPCAIDCLGLHTLRSLAGARSLLAFRRRVTAERPDVVHAFFNDAAMAVPLACAGTGVPVVTSRRDLGFWYTRGTLQLLRLANRWAARVICNSQAVAGEAGRRERLAEGKITVIRNGLALPEFSPEPAPSDDGGVRICLLANLRPIKRMEDLVDAAAAIAEDVPDARFVIAGAVLDPTYAGALEARIAAAGLAGRFEFPGLVADPMALLGRCHVGVLTSASEGLSNAVMEYLAAGLPVICSAVGGNPELVEDGVNGYLYPVGDVAALAARLKSVSLDAAKRREFGRASRDKARTFSAERMVEAHMDVYRALQRRHG